MSWILSEQVKTDKAWTLQEYEYETEEEALCRGMYDKAANICAWYEVYHS